MNLNKESVMKTMIMVFLCFLFLFVFSGFARENILKSGNFEDSSSANQWIKNKVDLKGESHAALSETDPAEGKKSLRITLENMQSYVKLSPEKVVIIPGVSYEVSYLFRRSDKSLSPNLVFAYQLKDGRKGSFQFMIDARKCRDEILNEWYRLHSGNISAVHWLPSNSLVRSRGLSDGKLLLLEELFGKEEVACDVFFTVSGRGCLHLDDVRLAPVQKKRSVLEVEAEAEAKRLLIKESERHNSALKKSSAENKRKNVLNFQIPLKREFPPLDFKKGMYPEAEAYHFDGARVLHYGKPLMMLGAEMLDPYTLKMFGFDYYVKSAFLNFLTVSEKNNVMTVRDAGNYPFLEAEIKSYLKEGVQVWLDFLTGKGGRSQALANAFPELFTTGGHFFAWNQEDPRSIACLRSLWSSALNQSRKYPVMFYETFNEVVYEDASSENLRLFRAELKKKYQTVDAFNIASGTRFQSFDDVIPFLPELTRSLFEQPSGNLKAEWNSFTGKRFAEIARDSAQFIRGAIPEISKVSFQSVYGFPDGSVMWTDPVNAPASQDFIGAESGAVFYPQKSGEEDESVILAESHPLKSVRFFREMFPGKPVFDGEMSIQPGVTTFSEKNIISDFGRKMKFRSGAEELSNAENDLGRRENWTHPDYDDSHWKEISVPGMWGKLGFPKTCIGYYRAEFMIPENNTQKLYLCGKELADSSEIYLNGKRIGTTRAFYDQFCLDVSDTVIPGGKNVLAIRIYNPCYRNGYNWGGIRGDLVLLNVPGYSNTVFTPDQMAFLLYQRAMLGYNGTCLSYFYMNWTLSDRCALLNPNCFEPAVWEKLPEIKNRIRDLGEIIYPRKRKKAEIGMLFSVDSANAYLSKKEYVPSERSDDFARWACALAFSGYDYGVFSEQVLEDYERLKQYRAVVIRLSERLSLSALKNLRRYAEEGGVLFVDGFSMNRSSWNNQVLHAEELLGCKRGKFSRSAGTIRLESFSSPVPLVRSHSRPEMTYVPLELLPGTESFAAKGEETVGAVRKTGKGMVITFSAEIPQAAMQKVFARFLIPAGIFPLVRIDQAPYVEVLRSSDEKGRYLFGIFNWGGDAEVKLSRFRLPDGNYRLRDAVSGEFLKNGKQTLWNSMALRKGFTRKIKNFEPCLLLFEKADLPLLELTDIPKEQQEALEKFWKPFWRDPSPVKKRILWYGDSRYNTVMMSSAVNLLHQNGIAVDNMISTGFPDERVRVFRDGKNMETLLSDYDLIVIPTFSHRILNAGLLKGLQNYLQQEGKSLLLLGTHVRGLHMTYAARNKAVLQLVNGEASFAAAEDPKNNRMQEARLFNTGKIVRHPVTEGVYEFGSLGSCFVSLKNGINLISAPPQGKYSSILSVREENGVRIASIGDSDWLTPNGLETCDNALLWNNLSAWLCRIAPLKPQIAKDAVQLPRWQTGEKRK